MQKSQQVSSAAASAGKLEIEGRSIDFVPHNERRDKLSTQGPFWFVGNFTFFTTTIGFVGPSVGLNPLWTAIAGTLGIMFGTLFMAFHGSQGPHLGLPQMIQSRAQFGYRGVILVLFATLFVFAGFNIVNLVLMMQGLNALFHWLPIMVVAVVTVPSMLLAILGHDWIHKTFKWSLYVSLPLYGAITLAVMTSWLPGALGAAGIHAQPMPALGFNWTGVITQFAAGASYNIAYAPYVSDYTRYLPKHTRSGLLILAVFLGASLSGAWMIALGGWLSVHLGTADILVALNSVGSAVGTRGGALVVALAILVFLPVIAMNIYSAKLTAITGWDSFFKVKPTPKVRVWAIVFVVLLQSGVAIFINSSSSGLSILNIYLVVMLYFLVPWTAVNLTDYFFVRRGRYAIPHFFLPQKDNIYGLWGRRGLVAYLIGFVTMIPFFCIYNGPDPVFVGPMSRLMGNIDLAWLVGLIVSGTAYYLLCLSHDLPKEREFIRRIEEHSPHLTTGDGW